jgi:uncharacterized protein, YhcH/YjgK/YiaL family
MILDNLKTSLTDYGNIDGRLARAFEWLKSQDLAAIAPNQVITIDGDRIKAQIQEYATIAETDGFFEAHRAYIDIQIVVKGSEIMYWCPLSNLTAVKEAYDWDKDMIKYEEPKSSVPILVEEGHFAVFFPTDGHKPKIQNKTSATVRKIVVKVAVG